MALKVLGVGSSMREGSYGTRALKIVLERMEKLQAETHLLDLRKAKFQLLILIHLCNLVKE